MLRRKMVTTRLLQAGSFVLTRTKTLPFHASSPRFLYWCDGSQRTGRHFCCTVANAAAMDDDEYHYHDTMTDFFALLGVSRKFLLDPKELQSSYRKLMAKHHPDMRNQRSQDSDNDEYDASQITHAYDTLRKPHTRATHLLELSGRPMEETANAASLVSPDFLMNVMEWREAIDSMNEGSQDGIRELEELLGKTQEEIDNVLVELGAAFENQNLERALQLSAELQYWHRIEETIQDKL